MAGRRKRIGNGFRHSDVPKTRLWEESVLYVLDTFWSRGPWRSIRCADDVRRNPRFLGGAYSTTGRRPSSHRVEHVEPRRAGRKWHTPSCGQPTRSPHLNRQTYPLDG